MARSSSKVLRWVPRQRPLTGKFHHGTDRRLVAALRHWRSAEIDPEKAVTISESTQYFSYARSMGNNCGFQTTSHRWLSGS